MPSQGYVRFPTIFQDNIIFVAEDDLWSVSSTGGRATRLTAGLGEVRYPRFSRDGTQLAFVGREEGPTEVYVMPTIGGDARRLTFQSSSCRVLGWSLTGDEILYASNYGQFASRFDTIHAVNPASGFSHTLHFGMANAISYGPHGGIVLGRNINVREYSHWKRYRGGTAGYLWCDTRGTGDFQPLLQLHSNIADPCWVGDRIYFLSDHEGIGNVYSCTPTGEDLRKHTNHTDFYARHLSTDGERLVYQCAADLHVFDPADEAQHHLEVTLPSTHTQRNRKFVSASVFLHSYDLHPKGHSLALTTRGKAFSAGNWDGPAIQHGEPDGVRYRLLTWLYEGKQLVAIHDKPGHEELIVFSPNVAADPQTFPALDFGRAVEMKVSPTANQIVITNHRNEIISVDLDTASSRVLDHSDAGNIDGCAWSPDGAWVAYGFPISNRQTAIKLCHLDDGQTYQVTNPILQDTQPAFDPDGKYLYFLGKRVFNPVYDDLQFDLGFPRGTKPYAILLQSTLRSPFIPEPTPPEEKGQDKPKTENDEAVTRDQEEKPAFAIDLDNIADRVLPFPVSEGKYKAIYGIKGKALFLSSPIQGTVEEHPSHAKGTVEYYDFETYKSEKLLEGVSDFELSLDSKTLAYRSHHRLRILKAGEKPKSDSGDRPGRESGWFDFGRIKISVQPLAEWRQMFGEAWRLQREQFWNADMSGLDWEAIYKQYLPLVERVGSRAELSDLLWELQGELGTSHAYEMGGEYRKSPHYRQGFLGVDWNYDIEKDRYTIAQIIKGDPSDAHASSPLTQPGLNVKAGDAVLAINGQRVNAQRSPQELLVNQAGEEVQLLIEDVQNGETRVITVEALEHETPVRYREWVEHNRQLVHAATQNRVGYVHIPDMMGNGFAEFHRSYLVEYDYPALLIDVRWNSGGHVSGLLLEKLSRRRLGYDFSRWGQPEPYPAESPRGPMVALTNEHAGSDGDIFSHSFKLMGLGPLIGRRTWGGVIGINPHHQLVDNTTTTQPEFSFWFKDVGWNVENYGTDPDIAIDITPQDFAQGKDPQLQRAIAETLQLIEKTPVLEPKTGERPRLARTN